MKAPKTPKTPMTPEERKKAKRDATLKAMNNERSREVVHKPSKPITKSADAKRKAQEKKKRAAKKRSEERAKKRYNARVWRGWRESDGENHPVVVMKASDFDKENK